MAIAGVKFFKKIQTPKMLVYMTKTYTQIYGPKSLVFQLGSYLTRLQCVWCPHFHYRQFQKHKERKKHARYSLLDDSPFGNVCSITQFAEQNSAAV
jgi:hypothetical protein